MSGAAGDVLPWGFWGNAFATDPFIDSRLKSTPEAPLHANAIEWIDGEASQTKPALSRILTNHVTFTRIPSSGQRCTACLDRIAEA